MRELKFGLNFAKANLKSGFSRACDVGLRPLAAPAFSIRTYEINITMQLPR